MKYSGSDAIKASLLLLLLVVVHVSPQPRFSLILEIDAASSTCATSPSSSSSSPQLERSAAHFPLLLLPLQTPACLRICARGDVVRSFPFFSVLPSFLFDASRTCGRPPTAHHRGRPLARPCTLPLRLPSRSTGRVCDARLALRQSERSVRRRAAWLHTASGPSAGTTRRPTPATRAPVRVSGPLLDEFVLLRKGGCAKKRKKNPDALSQIKAAPLQPGASCL